MSLGTLLFASIALIVMVGFAGLLAGGGFRGAMRALLGLMVLVFGAATLASLYAGFALASQGGGMLVFLAIPAGLVTCFAAIFFSTLGDAAGLERMSPREREAYADTQFDAMRESLTASIAEKRKQLGRFWLSPSRRRSLEASLAVEESLLRDSSRLETDYRNAQAASPAGDRR
jgi:hypothetical protein